jgi:hypothetical protein
MAPISLVDTIPAFDTSWSFIAAGRSEAATPTEPVAVFTGVTGVVTGLLVVTLGALRLERGSAAGALAFAVPTEAEDADEADAAPAPGAEDAGLAEGDAFAVAVSGTSAAPPALAAGVAGTGATYAGGGVGAVTV